ncbi:hypothetical protein GCM10023237_40220 [Streptomyces coeruleoprunus]
MTASYSSDSRSAVSLLRAMGVFHSERNGFVHQKDRPGAPRNETVSYVSLVTRLRTTAPPGESPPSRRAKACRPTRAKARRTPGESPANARSSCRAPGARKA